MQWNRYRILLATPQGLDSSALVIAADRADGLGILDGTGQDTRNQAIRRLRDFKVRSYAIRVQPHEVCQDWLDQAGENLVAACAPTLGRRNNSGMHALGSMPPAGERCARSHRWPRPRLGSMPGAMA